MSLSLDDPRYWHHLYQQLHHENDSTRRAAVISEVASLVTHDPYVELLRQTFLSEFSKSDEHIYLAGLAIQHQSPPNIECLTAIAALGCLRALAKPNREQFIHSIMNAQLPKIITTLNRHACELITNKMKPRLPQKINRVLIIPSFFSNPMHTPSMLTVNYAAIFHQLGYRVLICAPQELKPFQMENYHGAGRVVNLPAIDLSSWSTFIPNEITTLLLDGQLSMEDRYRKTLDIASQFDPDLVLSVGPYSPIASAFYSIRPVLALPTNTVSFLGDADVWLRGSDIALSEEEITWNQQFSKPTSALHPYRIFPSHLTVNSLSREQLGIDKDAVVLVTIGFRLNSEITPKWADQLSEIINRHDNVVWVLIGDQTPSYLNEIMPGKIINLGIQKRASDYLDLCDIYLNPPRMGGGFSVLEAMSKGCAVVAYMHSDGGEKVGATAVKDDQEYFAQLNNFIINSKERAHQGKQLTERFESLYDLSKSGPSLINACQLALKIFQDRVKLFV